MYTHSTNHHIIFLMSFWLPMHRVSLVVCFDRSKNELSVGFRAALPPYWTLDSRYRLDSATTFAETNMSRRNALARAIYKNDKDVSNKKGDNLFKSFLLT